MEPSRRSNCALGRRVPRGTIYAEPGRPCSFDLSTVSRVAVEFVAIISPDLNRCHVHCAVPARRASTPGFDHAVGAVREDDDRRTGARHVFPHSFTPVEGLTGDVPFRREAD